MTDNQANFYKLVEDIEKKLSGIEIQYLSDRSKILEYLSTLYLLEDVKNKDLRTALWSLRL